MRFMSCVQENNWQVQLQLLYRSVDGVCVPLQAEHLPRMPGNNHENVLEIHGQWFRVCFALSKDSWILTLPQTNYKNSGQSKGSMQ